MRRLLFRALLLCASDIIVGALIIAVYIPAIAPGIAGGDSGELVAESCHLGTAHPPGYPLFIIINHLATQYLPRMLDTVGLRPGPAVNGLASPAWCANATAAVLGTLAAMYKTKTVQLLCSRWGQGRRTRVSRLSPPCGADDSGGGECDVTCYYRSNRDYYDRVCEALAAGCAGALMAFSPLVWQYSVTAEVFALNNFLLSLLCYLTVVYASFGRNVLHAALGAFVSGLALSNQHTAVLYIAPLAAWVMIQLVTSRCRLYDAAEPHWRLLALEVVTLAAFFALGLAPYAMLYLAALTAPRPGSWGNLQTLRGFLRHLLRRDYGSWRLYSGTVAGGGQGLIERLQSWGKDVWSVQGLSGVVPFLAVCGVVAALNVCFKNYLVFSFAQSNSKISTSYLPLMKKKTGQRSGSSSKLSTTDKEECSTAPDSSSLNFAQVSRSNQSAGRNINNSSGEIFLEQTVTDRTKSQGIGRNHSYPHEQLLPEKTDATNHHQQSPTIPPAALLTLKGVLARCDDDGASAPMSLLFALALYLVVFHWLSNMPLDDPLLYGVHARFWMQPNILVFTFCGVGLYRTFRLFRLVYHRIIAQFSSHA